jgi:hypothetical protein
MLTTMGITLGFGVTALLIVGAVSTCTHISKLFKYIKLNLRK